MPDFSLLSASETLANLRVSLEGGLSTAEIQRRQKKFGTNAIPTDDPWHWFKLFAERFRDPLVLILLAAAVISGLGQRYEDAVIIVIALFLDIVLSFIQLARTERTLAHLSAQVPDTISVIRDNRSQMVSVRSLVPGDILEVRAGEYMPADARVVRSQGLAVNEASLTGEARDIPKTSARLTHKTGLVGRRNMLFSGSTVVTGSGIAVVVATGLTSEFGKIAKVLRRERSPISPLRRKLSHQGVVVAWIIVIAVAVIMAIGIWEGRGWLATFRVAIPLVVSAIPEDLTVILTIALTVGVTRILRHRGVVRDLHSGETLGSATIICTDKTGTLTEGKMQATELDFLQGEVLRPEEGPPRDAWQQLAVTGLVVASAAYPRKGVPGEFFGSATERAALAFAEACGVSVTSTRETWKVISEIPFDSKWKYRAALAVHPTQNHNLLFVSGAPEVILHHSSSALNRQREVVPLTSIRRRSIQATFEERARQESRLVAVAVRRGSRLEQLHKGEVKELTFLGVLAIQDPVRPEVAQAMAETQAAGVAVKLVTGDLSATAIAVARRVGLSVPEEAIMSGELLHELPDKELSERLPSVTVFSRVEPLDKQRIVRLLQARGEVVAMTGDGVNDAVALKAADIGVAMGSGTDIAKEAADLVLLNNSFATIVAAIREGRVIRDNVRRVILFLLATNAAEVAIFFGSLLLGLPLPMTAAQILWINLVTDGTSDIALSLERAERNVMKRPPEHPNAPLISKRLYGHLAFSGLILTLATLGLYWYLLERLGSSLPYAQTMAFSFLAVTSLLSVWSFRSFTESILKRGFTQNIFVPLSAALSFGLHLLAIYVPAFRRFFETVPLSLRDWGLLLGLGLVTIIMIDLRKKLFPFTAA